MQSAFNFKGCFKLLNILVGFVIGLQIGCLFFVMCGNAEFGEVFFMQPYMLLVDISLLVLICFIQYRLVDSSGALEEDDGTCSCIFPVKSAIKTPDLP